MAGKLRYPRLKGIRQKGKSVASKFISKSYKELLKPYNLKGKK